MTSVIPQNATIKNAVLSLFFREGSAGNESTCVYKITKGWDESSVTWLRSDATALWNTAGGDFDVATETKTDYAQEMSWENYDVTDIVKSFVSGSPNYGFLVIPDVKDGNDGRIYASSEYSDGDSVRPKLTITYEKTAIHCARVATKGKSGMAIKRNGAMLLAYVPFENVYRITLYNASGTVIKGLTGYGAEWQPLNETPLAQGIYFIRIFSGEKCLSGKFMQIRQ